MTCVHLQTHSLGGLGCCYKLRQYRLTLGRAMAGRIRLGVELDSVSAHFLGKHHGCRVGVHEQTDPRSPGLGLGDEGSQALGILREAPAVVGGELAFGVRHKGDLLRTHFVHQGHEVVKRVALDVVFAVRPSFE